jgi:hypothetical protein
MSIDLQDVRNIEEGECSETEFYTSVQRAINSLDAWKMQGSYGRTMMTAIEDGRCMLATSDTRDYYGNHIPSRDQVETGTKGSRQFVVDNYGEEWAVAMEAVK